MKCNWLLLLLSLPAGLPSVGCEGDTKDHDPEHEESAPSGSTTGAICDPNLTYAGDIAPIVSVYCTRCHATQNAGSARMGAPSDHNFDSEAGLLEHAAHVDEYAGSGPAQTHMVMPPSAPKPSVAERETLSRYLACHL